MQNEELRMSLLN